MFAYINGTRTPEAYLIVVGEFDMFGEFDNSRFLPHF